jgi:predicted dinucleotide-binding enzyme
MPSFRIILLAALVATAAPAGADDCIAMIGTGSVGGALGPRFAGIGERIVYGSRTPETERIAALVERTGAGTKALSPDAAARVCDTIVLAVPWFAVEETVNRSATSTAS